MAKKRRVVDGRGRADSSKRDRTASGGKDTDRGVPSGGSSPAGSASVDPTAIALGLLAGGLVYLAYFPSDSVAVEKGQALWFSLLAIAIGTIALPWSFVSRQPGGIERPRSLLSIGLDVAPWLLAAWMMLAAFMTCPPGNLRMATNEAWLWVAGAAIFTAARRLLEPTPSRRALFLLILLCACGLSVHGMHQYFISLPATRADYREDPEAILAEAGYDAPPGSAERMMFENRLFDGGPSATFALANSLAAVALVGAILSLGVMRLRWSDLSWLARVGWSIALLLCLSALFAARSRSASLALVAGVILLLLAASRLRNTRPAHLLTGLAVVSVAAVFTAAGLAVFGNREWFEQAPASLAFRFQYWRSTWQLALDRPLAGAGPGNFQSIYERYREPSATEQIAEPHNFLFETLGSGGFVGLGILIAVIVMAAILIGRQWSVACPEEANPEEAERDSAEQATTRWVWLGAALGFVLVWGIGLATLALPDVDANLMAIPVVIAGGFVLWPSMRRLRSGELDLIAAVALSALMIHLLVAGGWTVPGIAILAWLFAALLTRARCGAPMASGAANADGATAADPSYPVSRTVEAASSSSAASGHRASSGHGDRGSEGRRVVPVVGVAAIGVVLMVAIYGWSLTPVGEKDRAMSEAEYRQSKGQVVRARSSLNEALAADPHSPDAAVWLADFYHWQLVLDEPSPEIREEWNRMISLAKSRAGDDPALYRVLGSQQLHLFQRYGDPRDLASASETFGLAAAWSPSSEWLAAQLAAVLDASGEPTEAAQWATKAEHLSSLGGNIERSLERQQIFVPADLGTRVNSGVVRQPASEVLANHLAPNRVDPEK